MTTPGLPPDVELAAGQLIKAQHLRDLRTYVANTAAAALAPSNTAADGAVARAVTAGTVLSPTAAAATYTASTTVRNIVVLTQAAYDALTPKVTTTLYAIEG